MIIASALCIHVKQQRPTNRLENLYQHIWTFVPMLNNRGLKQKTMYKCVSNPLYLC